MNVVEVSVFLGHFIWLALIAYDAKLATSIGRLHESAVHRLGLYDAQISRSPE